MHDNVFHLKNTRPHKVFTLWANICNYDELRQPLSQKEQVLTDGQVDVLMK